MKGERFNTQFFFGDATKFRDGFLRRPGIARAIAVACDDRKHRFPNHR